MVNYAFVQVIKRHMVYKFYADLKFMGTDFDLIFSMVNKS